MWYLDTVSTDPDDLLESLPDVVGRATDYAGLLKLIVQRRHEIGLPQTTVDAISGLAPGYTGKLECGVKRLGALSLGCLLGAVGLELIVVRKTPHHLKQARKLAA